MGSFILPTFIPSFEASQDCHLFQALDYAFDLAAAEVAETSPLLLSGRFNVVTYGFRI